MLVGRGLVSTRRSRSAARTCACIRASSNARLPHGRELPNAPTELPSESPEFGPRVEPFLRAFLGASSVEAPDISVLPQSAVIPMKHTRDRAPRESTDARRTVNEGAESLTDPHYWDKTWAGRTIPPPLDWRGRGLNATVPRRWHRFFSQAFASLGIGPGDRLLEAGCGGSVFLPYFVTEHGLAAEGLDNSPEGCELSGAIARRSGIFTPIHFGDVLHPDASLLGRYRAVFSLGLAEHFVPTTSIINALSVFLQPSGWLITVVPNMHGTVGMLQKLVDPGVYGIHVPLSPTELAEAHRACSLSVLSAQHLMTANFSVVNFSGPGSRMPPGIGLRLTSWTNKLIWSLERAGLPEMPNRWMSPYVVVVAQRAITAAPPGVTQ
jgi:hypothetical protein